MTARDAVRAGLAALLVSGEAARRAQGWPADPRLDVPVAMLLDLADELGGVLPQGGPDTPPGPPDPLGGPQDAPEAPSRGDRDPTVCSYPGCACQHICRATGSAEKRAELEERACSASARAG